MFFHHLKFFVRKVRKDGFTYLLSHLGLVIGLCTLILLGTYIYQEFTVGTYVKNHERIYRLNTQLHRGGATEFALSFGYLKEKLVSDFPEIEAATRIMQSQGQSVFRVEDRTFNIAEGTAFYVDEDFLDVFELPVSNGNRNTALSRPDAIVLTESFATRLFGTRDPIGAIIENIQQEGNQNLVVTAVLEDLPTTSHFQFDYILSGQTLGYWDYLATLEAVLGNYVYYKAHSPVNTSMFDEELLSRTPEISPSHWGLISLPLASIHFESEGQFEHARTGNSDQLLLIGFAGLLLFVASFINYLIIHMSQLIDRSGEFAIKKAMGISSRQWLGQFVVESISSIALISLGAIVCAYYFDQLFLADTLGNRLFTTISVNQLVFFGALTLMMAIITMTFSILKLRSQFGLSLKNRSLTTKASKGLKNQISLLVQFSFTLLILCGSYFVWQQLRHLQSIDMGYSGEWRINITRSSDTSHGIWTNFKNSLSTIPGVKSQGSSLYEWAGSMYNTGRVKITSDQIQDSLWVRVKYNYISDGLLPTLGLDLISGRNFNQEYAEDTFNLLVNETAAKAFGTEEIVGKRFESSVFDDRSGKVIGVVKDFHVESIEQEVAPMVLFFHHQDLWKENLIVQVNEKNLRQTLDAVQAVWNESGVISPFEYTFLDQFQARLFERETQNAQFMGITASCSIMVALIGLIGLVSFQNKRRSKELSLRKVFGASVSQLLLMINKKYLILIGLSIVISVPVAYWAVSQWLQGYAYRISPTIWDFGLVIAAVILVSLITVSLQSWKTAHSNPTDVLRSE